MVSNRLSGNGRHEVIADWSTMHSLDRRKSGRQGVPTERPRADWAVKSSESWQPGRLRVGLTRTVSFLGIVGGVWVEQRSHSSTAGSIHYLQEQVVAWTSCWDWTKGLAKREHIVAATLLTWLLFSKMLTRFATRATFVADTNFVSWTQEMFLKVFTNNCVHAARFATDGHHRSTQCCRHNVSSFCQGARVEKRYTKSVYRARHCDHCGRKCNKRRSSCD